MGATRAFVLTLQRPRPEFAVADRCLCTDSDWAIQQRMKAVAPRTWTPPSVGDPSERVFFEWI